MLRGGALPRSRLPDRGSLPEPEGQNKNLQAAPDALESQVAAARIALSVILLGPCRREFLKLRKNGSKIERALSRRMVRQGRCPSSNSKNELR